MDKDLVKMTCAALKIAMDNLEIVKMLIDDGITVVKTPAETPEVIYLPYDGVLGKVGKVEEPIFTCVPKDY